MRGIHYLQGKTSKTYGYMLIGLLIMIYCIESLPLASLIGSSFFNYGLKPILWLGLAFVVWLLPKPRIKGKLKMKETINWWAISFSIIFIISSVLAGLIDGFGKSPYNHSIMGITFNILLVGSTLIGMEFVRSYVVNSFTQRENHFLFIMIAFLMAILSISLNQFLNIKGYVQAVQFGAQYFVPGFTKNLLATYLAFLGGPLPSIIYMGIMEVFHWLSPVLPDLQWITQALIGTLVPLFSFIFLENMYLKATRQDKASQPKEGLLGWVITSVVSIAIVWFAVGVFPIYPSVIATGSMQPMIDPGDVILVDKAREIEDINQLQVGDVIQFQRGNILISHRVIEVIEEEGVASYRTKGDNNSVADSELVMPENIKGKIVKVVPKIGWPTLLLKSNKDVPDLDMVQK